MTTDPALVLFDFWGVIGLVQTAEHQAAMARRAGTAAEQFTAAYWRHRPPYDSGASAEHYWQAVLADVGVVADADMVADLVGLDVESWSGVDPEMVALVADVAATDKRLGLLSNAPLDLVDHASGVVAQHIPDRVFSCQQGVAKPDPALYERAIELLAVPAAQILFVDDSLPNLEAARAAGMAALHHQSVAQTRRVLLG